MNTLIIDTNLPAGNIILDKIEGDEVFVHQDMRDTEGGWFYWAFRVLGAAGRTLTFHFTGYSAVGSRGPAVSFDKGETWEWGDLLQSAPVDEQTKDHLGDREFTWKFGKTDDEIWFSQMLPYGVREWRKFIDGHAEYSGKVFEESVLCKTLKGRDVEYARFGRLDGKAKFKFFMTSRHHCEEASATYVLEGILSTAMADDELGAWLRENVEIRSVPFVDKDGVVDGDQGKNRKPHDHARDYNPGGEILYPTTSAIIGMLEKWRPTVVMDIHAPWLRGTWFQENNSNEFFYQVGTPNPVTTEQQNRFGKILEKTQQAGVGYMQSDDYWYGRGWNAGANFTQGRTMELWASYTLTDAAFVTSFEIPFANARFKTLHQDDFRSFGRDIVRALRKYLGTLQ